MRQNLTMTFPDYYYERKSKPGFVQILFPIRQNMKVNL
jgi:hypothetical protein